MGKILFVDLSSSRTEERPTQPYAEKYVGGRGIAARIYWEMAKPATKPFDADNPLIFMSGPLTGVRAQGATILAVVSKSPGALPESYCYGNIGGYVGPELKKAGYDGIVVTGRAPRPVYIYVGTDRVEIRDATHLWGKNAREAGAALGSAEGAETRFITIGVSGERLVRTAVAYASHESAVSCGFGAVMGSKNLKGIAIRGSRKIGVADPEELRGLNRRTVAIDERLHLAIGPDTEATGRAGMLEVIGRGGCHLCGASCIRNVYRYDGRLEGLRHCQTMEYYLPWIYGRDDEPMETYFSAPDLANDYCIDTFELRTMIQWLHAGFDAGVLTEAFTGLPLAKIGTREFLEQLLHSIAYREGFGDLLAEGMARVRSAEEVPAEARALIPRGVAPIGEFELQPPRLMLVHALLYPLEPRVHQPLLHDTGMVMVPWTLNQMQPGSTNVTNRVVRDIAKAFWGGEDAGVFNSYEGKAPAAKIIQDRVILKDSLGLCDFTWPITYSFATTDRVGDPNLEGELYSAVTGRPAGELSAAAETIADLQRAILIREGREQGADYPQEFHFTERLERSGMHWMMVPGEGDAAVDMAGNVLDRAKFTAMLREYYRLRGWDEETGIPRAQRTAVDRDVREGGD